MRALGVCDVCVNGMFHLPFPLKLAPSPVFAMSANGNVITVAAHAGHLEVPWHLGMEDVPPEQFTYFLSCAVKYTSTKLLSARLEISLLLALLKH